MCSGIKVHSHWMRCRAVPCGDAHYRNGMQLIRRYGCGVAARCGTYGTVPVTESLAGSYQSADLCHYALISTSSGSFVCCVCTDSSEVDKPTNSVHRVLSPDRHSDQCVHTLSSACACFSTLGSTTTSLFSRHYWAVSHIQATYNVSCLLVPTKLRSI